MKIKRIDTRNELVDQWTNETYENYTNWHRNELEMNERNIWKLNALTQEMS